MVIMMMIMMQFVKKLVVTDLFLMLNVMTAILILTMGAAQLVRFKIILNVIRVNHHFVKLLQCFDTSLDKSKDLKVKIKHK